MSAIWAVAFRAGTAAAQRIEMDVRATGAAQLDYTVGAGLRQVRCQVHAEFTQGGQVLALLLVLSPADRRLQFGLLTQTLAVVRLLFAALAQLGLLTLAGQFQIVLDLGRLLGAALRGASELRVELVV